MHGMVSYRRNVLTLTTSVKTPLKRFMRGIYDFLTHDSRLPKSYYGGQVSCGLSNKKQGLQSVSIVFHMPSSQTVNLGSVVRVIVNSSVVIVLLLSSVLSIDAQTSTKGSIVGKVIDAKTKEPLASTNVTIKGTYYGAVTDLDGNFMIANVNPGTYIVEVSLLGYKAVQFTGVKVNAGEEMSLDVKLEETVLSLGQEVVIIGERPLFNLEETQSTRSIGSEDIKAAAVQSVKDIISMQTGVVQADNEIHIRGGRTYENAYLLDGVSVQDPLAGTGFGLQLAPAAIQEAEVITGGYNAEYGQATSGIVNITTKEGTKRYNGSFGYKRDHFGFNKDSRSNANTDIYEMSLSGPEPLTTYALPALGSRIPGDLTFFGTFYTHFTDGYTQNAGYTRWAEKIIEGKPVGYETIVPNKLYSSLFGGETFLAPRRSNSWSWLTKFTWKPITTIKTSYTYSSSITIDQNSQSVQATLEYVEPNPGFQFEFLRLPDSSNVYTQRSIQHSFSLTHTLSSKTFYELKFSHYTAHVRGDANGNYFNQYNEPKDIITLPIEYYNKTTDTIGIIPGDGFYDIGNPSRWRDHYLSEYTYKGDLTHHFTEKHKFKTGLEMRFQDLQMVDLIAPWFKPLGLNYDIYSVRPSLGALYAQDNITLKGMILNFGLRLDYWLPGKFVDQTLSLPAESINVAKSIQEAYFDDTFSLFGRRWKARLSPRLGISHPVSDNQTLFFSYGHFSKLPRPQFVYAKLARSSARSTFQTIGNPNLNPETTVSYELGLRNQLSESDVLTVTAYYKDIFDYITSRTVRAASTRFSGGSYTTYVNLDYTRVRGLEVEYKTRIGNWFRGTISGSYSIATGKSSSSTEALFNLQQGLEENIKETPMVFSRPIQLGVNLNFSSRKGQPLFGFGRGILENYNLFIRIFYQSGKRYTKQIFVGNDAVNGRPMYVPDFKNPLSELADPWFYTNVNFEKYFDIGIGKLAFSLEIQNLLDRKNAQIINPVTGRAYKYGDPTLQSVNDPLYPDLTYPVDPYPYNPARYLNPRTYRLGMSFEF
ncbi:MAG: TonB-dependent receptor [Ignavibacteriae bacterium]|nr:TonB-dependent receptor [Ignavibacteriota bacterium]